MKYGRPHAIEIFSSKNRMSPERIRMTEVGTSEVRRSKNTLQRVDGGCRQFPAV